MNVIEIKENERPMDWKIYPNIDMNVFRVKELQNSMLYKPEQITFIIEYKFLVPVKRGRNKFLVPFRKRFESLNNEEFVNNIGNYTESVLIEVEQIKEKAKFPKKSEIDKSSPIVYFKIVK